MKDFSSERASPHVSGEPGEPVGGVRYIGQPVLRFEDRRLLTGAGRYTDDFHLDGMLRCVFLRSPHAHARLLRLEVARAVCASGVAAVFTAADYAADGLHGIAHAPNPADALDVSKRALLDPCGASVPDIPHWPLAGDRVRHVGECVAVVIAATVAQAHDAADLIEARYEVLPSVTSPDEAAQPGAPQLYEAMPGNSCFRLDYGDAEATRRALAGAAQVVRHRFVANRVANCQMEPRAAIGVFESSTGTHELISGSQGVHLQRMMLAGALGAPAEKVRVICPEVGGGFGPRQNLYPEQVLVVWAARRLGRPVKWTADRSESFLADFAGRDSVADAALGLDRDGRILAYEVEWFGNVGAHTVTYVPMSNGRRLLTTVYDIPSVRATLHGMLTNTVPTAPYRGAGRPEAHHAIERLLDIAAGRLGLDRVEIRRRNIVPLSRLPYRNAMGLVYDSGDFAGYMELALKAGDWDGFGSRRDEAHRRGKLAGIGLANYIESPVGVPLERVCVRVSSDDTIDVITGTQSTGQGHETSFAQVIAEYLCVPVASVRVRYGDSAFVAAGGGTHSDRSMRLTGTLLVQAAAQIIESGKAAAASLLEAAADDLVFEEGGFRISGTDRRLSLFEVARAIEERRVPDAPPAVLSATCNFNGRLPAYPAGSTLCELEVDRDTGGVEITRYTTVDDCGRIINPMIVAGQVHGGIAQGIGQALHESVMFNGSGQVLNGSFMDYGIPRADDLPAFRVEHAEHATAGNPLRVKGAGEGGTVPATAAVLNALCDALRWCVEDLEMPVSAQKVWAAMHPTSRARDLRSL